MSDSEGDYRPKKGPSAFAAAALMESDSDSDSDGGSSPVVESKPAASKPKVEEAPKAATKAAPSKGKGKKGGKGGKAAADDDDDLDALLSELGSAPAAAAPAAAGDKKETSAAAADKKEDGKTVDAAAAYLASMGLGDDAAGGAGGAAAKDKKKKKKAGKKGGAGDAGEAGGEGSDDEGAAAAAAAPAAAAAGAEGGAAAAAGGGKKLSAAARAAQERLAAVQREAERKAREDEERRKREADLKAVEEEEDRKRRERREKEKRKERERKEREKAEGTYMTAKQKAALDRARARLGVNPSAAALAAAVAAEGGAAGGEDSGSDGEGVASPDAGAAGGAAAGGKKAPVKTAAMYASAGGKKKPAAAAAATAAATAAAAPAEAAASPVVEAAAPAAAVAAPAVTPASVPDPSAAAAAPAAAPAAPVILSVLAGGGDWEDAADDWETVASKADAITKEVAAKEAAEAKAKADAEAAAAAAKAGGAAGGAGGAADGGAGGAAAGSGSAGPSGPAPVLYYPNSKRRIPTAGESAGKPVEERIRDSRARREARLQLALASRTDEHLRSPICVVLGHVDTGKTSLLDKIRRTNVQEGEAGGITQQIGATYFPMDRLRGATDKLKAKDLLAGPDKPGSPTASATASAAASHVEYRVPGLLIIDTPGHESFVNLRSRGAGLCDIAVLVVDIMHGLERQTIESIQLLKQKKTKFVVALNKIDRMYGWKALKDSPVRESLAQQPEYAAAEFKTRADRVLTQLAEQGLNAKLYYENDDFRRNVSVVPTSAHTGEGIPDLLALIMQLTQSMMGHKLQFYDHVQATILEVKNIEGLGTTIDIVLVNGEIREGDTLVVCGMEGPIVTQARALLTPPPLREMRVKADYVHHKRIEAAMGVKISAQHLEKAVAGTSLLVAHPDDDIEDLKDEVMEDFDAIMKGFAKDARGVFVQASTLGSLEALLEYLRTHEPPVPVAQVGIGPLHRKDIVAASIMREHKVEYATILAFDVKVTPEATAAAADLGVTIFSADIIYHLTDMFEKYMKETVEAAQKAHAADAVFPAVLKIIPTAIFNKRDPIVLGVDVLEGKLRLNTPICVVLPEGTTIGGEDGAAGGAGGPAAAAPKGKGPVILTLGRVTGIERDHAARDSAEAGGPAVAVKIAPEDGAQALMFGRHFDASHMLYSRISRTSIDVLKENFRDQMSKADWKTVMKLKEVLNVQ